MTERIDLLVLPRPCFLQVVWGMCASSMSRNLMVQFFGNINLGVQGRLPLPHSFEILRRKLTIECFTSAVFPVVVTRFRPT